MIGGRDEAMVAEVYGSRTHPRPLGRPRLGFEVRPKRSTVVRHCSSLAHLQAVSSM